MGSGGLLQSSVRGTEQCYSATELEALAQVDTVKNFAYYL